MNYTAKSKLPLKGQDQDLCNIIYFIKQPLTKRDRDRFGIDYLLNQGYKISVFD